MNKKLQLFTKVSFILLGMLMLNSCEGDKYYPVEEIYYNDPSANWKIIPLEVESASASGNVDKWVWDDETRTYSCVLDLPEMDRHIYENGAILSYTFYGSVNNNETQYLIPLHIDGVNITQEVSYDLNQTICFYFHWDDYVKIDPGLYFFKVVLLYPSK